MLPVNLVSRRTSQMEVTPLKLPAQYVGGKAGRNRELGHECDLLRGMRGLARRKWRTRISVSAQTTDEQRLHPRFAGKSKRQELGSGRFRPARPRPAGPHDNVLFQGFNWESHSVKPWWTKLVEKVDDLAAAGITDVWLPPASQSVDQHGYLPGQLYNLDASKYGTREQLMLLNDTLHERGICSIADIVINHRSGWKQDSLGHWNVFEGGTPDTRLDWDAWAVVKDDIYDSGGQGHADSGESYAAAPDLDHSNKQVHDELTDWMNWLKAYVGFDGWRFDFVKGYAPQFVELYCERTLPSFAVGEYWTSMHYDGYQVAYDQNCHRQTLCDWIDGTGGRAAAFDFTTKGILQAAVLDELWRLRDPQGKPSGLIGWYPQKAVTFIDNHDTGSTQRHWIFPDDKVMQGYAYILTHPGIPCVFYDHFFDFGLQKEITALIDVRKRNRINAASGVHILTAESDIYVACIADRVTLKLGKRCEMGSLLPGSSWRLVTSGQDYAVWETTKPLPEQPVNPIPAALDNAKEEKTRPTQPVKITPNMSEKTIKRILEEVPEQCIEPRVMTGVDGGPKHTSMNGMLSTS